MYQVTISQFERAAKVVSPDRNQIPVGILAYMREHTRANVYNLVVEEFKKSGLSQAIIADRLGKRPEVISRWLGSPGNWGLDTVSDLLFAICGGEVEFNAKTPQKDQPQGSYWMTAFMSPSYTLTSWDSSLLKNTWFNWLDQVVEEKEHQHGG